MKGGASGSEGRLVFWGLLGGTSPLHAAVRQPAHTHGQIEIVQLLQTVDENADRGHWGLDAQESLLFAAALGGDMRIFNIIFEALIAKRHALDEARSPGAREPLWWPSEGRFLGPMGLFGHTSPIYAAVRACNVEMVQRLLELGAAPQAGSRMWLEHARYAHVCSRMLTYAHVCSRMLTLACGLNTPGMLTYAHVCSRMLTYAHVC